MNLSPPSHWILGPPQLGVVERRAGSDCPHLSSAAEAAALEAAVSVAAAPVAAVPVGCSPVLATEQAASGLVQRDPEKE